MKLQKLLISLTFVVVCFSGYSNSVPENVETVFMLIYNQQFSKADSILNNPTDNYDRFYHDILKLDLYYWEYSVEDNSEKSRQLQEFLAKFNVEKDIKVDVRLKELIFLSYSVRYELKRFNIPGAVILRTKIKKLLSEINEDKLHYPENRLKLFDLYKVLFTYFDNVFNPLFRESKRLERESALHKIEQFSNDDDLIVNTLANYFLGKIYLNIENNPPKSKIHLELLLEKYPENKSVSELLAHCNSKIKS